MREMTDEEFASKLRERCPELIEPSRPQPQDALVPEFEPNAVASLTVSLLRDLASAALDSTTALKRFAESVPREAISPGSSRHKAVKKKRQSGQSGSSA